MKRWPRIQGYGFNLLAVKGAEGQFIGSIDDGSPAEAAGLKKGDRLVEVNGTRVAEASHTEVVSEIKTHADEVKMLVLSPEAHKYYEEKDIRVHGYMSNVEVIECPDHKPGKH